MHHDDMRTTVDIPDALLREAKRRAAQDGKTLGQVVEDALRSSFQRLDAAAAVPVALPTYGEGGLLPGVDLDDSASLLDLMERGS